MSATQTDTFELTAGPCAAEGYWMTIQSGAFQAADGPLPVPSGHTLEGSWGVSGTVWSAGEDQHAAPQRLQLTWFSYAEDKFYEGDFALPQEKIQALLQQGTWDLERQKQRPYSELTVCVLPKGQ